MARFTVVVVLALVAACFAVPPPHGHPDGDKGQHHRERRHYVGGLNDFGDGGRGFGGGGYGGHGGNGGHGGAGLPLTQSYSKSSASASSTSGSGSIGKK